MKVQSTIKTGKVIEFDFTALPKVSQEALIKYGAQRWINDRVNSTTNSKKITETETIDQLGLDILARLQAGEIGPQRSGAVRDPFIEAQTRIVQEMLKEAKGVSFKDSAKAIRKHGLDAFKEKIGADKIEAEAKKRLDKAKKAAEIDLDLGDLV